MIAAALPGVTLFRSAAAVAAQALRRAGAPGRSAAEPPGAPRQTGGDRLMAEPPGAPRQTGTVRVLLSGRPADLPAAALRYPEGRLLARLVAGRPVPA
jgi:glutamate racemase